MKRDTLVNYNENKTLENEIQKFLDVNSFY